MGFGNDEKEWETKDMRAMNFSGSQYVDLPELNTLYGVLGTGFSSIRARRIVDNLIKKGELAQIKPDEKVTMVRYIPPKEHVTILVRVTQRDMTFPEAIEYMRRVLVGEDLLTQPPVQNAVIVSDDEYYHKQSYWERKDHGSPPGAGSSDFCCMMAMGELKSEESEEDYRDDDETENALALWAIQGGSSSQKPVTMEAIRAAARSEQDVTKPLSLSQLRETCNEISKSQWPIAKRSPPLTLAALKESCKKASEEAVQDVNLLTRSGQMY